LFNALQNIFYTGVGWRWKHFIKKFVHHEVDICAFPLVTVSGKLTKAGITYCIIYVRCVRLGGSSGSWSGLWGLDGDRWRALVSTVKNLRVP
jgi:hypothetical protein